MTAWVPTVGDWVVLRDGPGQVARVVLSRGGYVHLDRGLQLWDYWPPEHLRPASQEVIAKAQLASLEGL